MSRRLRTNVMVRVASGVLVAGLLTLMASTATVVVLVRNDKEASLVDAAVATTDARRNEIRHRLELARAQLRAVAFAVESGQLLDIPATVEGTSQAVLAFRDGEEIFEAGVDERAVERLRAAPRFRAGELRLEGRGVMLVQRAGPVTVRGLVDLADLLEVPEAWGAEMLSVPGADSHGPVVARKRGEALTVTAPVEGPLMLRVQAPVARRAPPRSRSRSG